MRRVPSKLIKVVPDTNLIISGFLWHGDPRQILNLAETNEIELYGSEETYNEFCDVIRREKFKKILASNIYTPEKLTLDYRGIINMVSLRGELADLRVVDGDKDDDLFFRTALLARAQIIISKDTKVLGVKKHAGIIVVDPATFLNDIFSKLKKGKLF
ncbi:MAG: putative toxin-antitoxin system toxin component, PIN family [bacterium]|nr:putative toxin-antitoxin system toxin component, PIN family [bacterium]